MKITTAGTQKESQVLDITPTKSNRVMHYDIDYDSMKPEETIKTFVASIRSMCSKYDSNKIRITEIENELLDIYHYIEISSYKTVPNGYKLYRRMAELRRERRACKNENDLLQPIYQFFHSTAVLDKLSGVQGECAKAKKSIDIRTYLVRTDILDEWLNPHDEKKEEKPTPILFDTDDLEEDIPIVPVVDDDELEDLAEEAKTDPSKVAKFKLAWEAAN